MSHVYFNSKELVQLSKILENNFMIKISEGMPLQCQRLESRHADEDV